MKEIAGEELLEMTDVAQFLNVKINTLYRMKTRGDFDVPSVKWGQKLYFRQDEIKKWFFDRKPKDILQES